MMRSFSRSILASCRGTSDGSDGCRSNATAQTLLIGADNILLTDDGLFVHVVHRLDALRLAGDIRPARLRSVTAGVRLTSRAGRDDWFWFTTQLPAEGFYVSSANLGSTISRDTSSTGSNAKCQRLPVGHAPR